MTMHIWMTVRVGAVAGALLVAGSVGAGPRTLTVDRDREQCPNAGFVSIQQAVTAASPGDEILVCPDVYTESVTVDKRLRLRGATKALDADRCLDPTGSPANDPTRDAVVAGGAFAFNLMADDVELRGFTVQGATIGVHTTDAFSGYRIRENVFQQNGEAGINFLSSGAALSRVDHNCFRTNGFAGLLSEVGDLRNARVDHNTSFGEPVGLDASGAGVRENVSIDQNHSRGEILSIVFSNSRDSAITHNVSEASPGNPLRIGGANQRLEISHNLLGAGPAAGIVFFTLGTVPAFPTPSVDIVVSHNEVSGRSTGILLLESSVRGSLFSHNKAHDSTVDGIRFEAGNEGNRVEHNATDRNARDGIRVNGAAGNTFTQNALAENGEHDAHDNDRAANTWTGNRCETDFPAGTICGR